MIQSAAFAILLALLLVPTASIAQLKVSYQVLPFAKFEEPEFFDAETESEQRVYRLEFGYPVLRRGREHIVMVKFEGQIRDFDYRNGDLTGDKVDQLYDLRLSLTDLRQVNDRWMLVTTITPGIASDLENSPSGDDFVFMASGLMRKQISRGTSWGIGLAYSNSFGQPLIIPLLNLSWQGDGRWSAKGTLPSNMGLWYEVSESVDLGLEARLSGNKFHAAPELYSDVDDPIYKFSTVSIGPKLKVSLTKKISVRGRVAFQPRDRFEFFDGEDKLATLDREAGVLYQLELKIAG